jgi:hypothetical protein
MGRFCKRSGRPKVLPLPGILHQSRDVRDVDPRDLRRVADSVTLQRSRLVALGGGANHVHESIGGDPLWVSVKVREDVGPKGEHLAVRKWLGVPPVCVDGQEGPDSTGFVVDVIVRTIRRKVPRCGHRHRELAPNIGWGDRPVPMGKMDAVTTLYPPGLEDEAEHAPGGSRGSE